MTVEFGEERGEAEVEHVEFLPINKKGEVRPRPAVLQGRIAGHAYLKAGGGETVDANDESHRPKCCSRE